MEPHRKLHALAGEWHGEEETLPSPWDPQGGPSTSTIRARMKVGGLFLVSDYVQLRGGEVTYRGHGIYGWDARDGRYTMYWFDSMGDNPAAPVRGTWEGGTLTFESQHGRYVNSFERDGLYRFRIEHSSDGIRWDTMMRASFTRTGAAPGPAST